MMSLFMLTGISLEAWLGHCQNSETGDRTSASAKGTNVSSACDKLVLSASRSFLAVQVSFVIPLQSFLAIFWPSIISNRKGIKNTTTSLTSILGFHFQKVMPP